MKSMVLTFACLAEALLCAAHSTEPLAPSVEWQPSATTVAARVRDLAEFGRAHGDDDAKLAEAVGELKETTAAKKSPPAWTTRTSWIDGSGTDQVFFGVGVFRGAISNRQLAFAVAENRARVEIAKLQKVAITRRSDANGWRTVTVTTTATLANVVIVDWYVDGTNVYALAAYAKPVTLAPDAPWIPRAASK